jgi:hypothetical protein
MDFIQHNMTMVIVGVVAVVLVLGVIIGIVSMKGGASTAQRWTHGAIGIWSGAEDSGTWPESRAKQSLQSWYGITDRPSLMKMVESLKGSAGRDSASWDMVRAIDLIRMGFAAGYLDEDDCWEKVKQVRELLQKQFTSWQDLATAFERGMHAWQDSRGQTDANERARVQKNLPVLEAQIWSKVKFSATWD